MSRSLLVALSFLTRLPVSPAATSPRDVGRSLAFFPVVGAALGAGLTLVTWLTADRVSSWLAAVMVAALAALVTGGLHLDGVADLFDGLGGGRGDRERTLRIMRDPTIGAHGAAALVLLLLLKVVALAECLHAASGAFLVPVFATSRFVVVPLALGFPYAREHGLGRDFHEQAGPAELGVAALVAGGLVGVAGLAVEALAAVTAVLAVGALVARRLGGLTGDVHGACIEMTETGFLVAIALSSG